MSDSPQAAEATAPPAAPATKDPARREQAVAVLGELLRLIDYPARIEAQDAADGGISVALHPDSGLTAIAAGKRSHVVDALQLVANKIVNRAGMDRRWISIGVGGYPAPRPPMDRARRPVPAPGTVAAVPAAPAAAPAGRPVTEPRPTAPASHLSPAPAASADQESQFTPAADPALAKALAEVAQKSAALGWFYSVAPMTGPERACALEAARGVAGVKVFAEGQGRNRRVVFAPEKPTPLPKRSALPQDDDEEEV